ncbi:MAG: dihydroorotate dehydrogenase-like protein [Candidatus Latescibacteria bacterium]|nr:dihydroorotate dehydrogenase-like protein [Candidatus Latescibacterota bacterium]
MNLATKYMGMDLANPLVASASPLSRQVHQVRQLEDAGAAAVVLYSLFEEEIRHESLALDHYLDMGSGSFAEALDYFPEHESYDLGSDSYLEHVRRLKEAVDIPIIGSLNGTTPGGWIEYAREIEQAGADALELNVYYIPTDIAETTQEVEDRYLDIMAVISDTVDIPVAVKLSPYFSALAHFAWQLDRSGAAGLVLFNRFYQPDIELETLEAYPHVLLSTPQEMRLPLRWIAILSGRIEADLAASTGIHTVEDVLKMLMAGASVTMMTSALLKHGPGHCAQVLAQMRQWMDEREYESVKQLQGSMSQRSCADPAAFERANYIKALATYK